MAIRSPKTTGIGLTIIALVAGLVLWAAPTEQTLGSGIKIVYLHVGLIWTGMLTLALAGLLGLVLLLRPNPGTAAWAGTLGWVGGGFFAAAVGISLWAEAINWGAIAWREPRTIAMLQLLALAVIVQVADTWSPPPRLQGLLRALLLAYLVWSTAAAPLQLHPRNPFRGASSPAIQAAFYGLFLLCSLAAAWLTFYLQPILYRRPTE